MKLYTFPHSDNSAKVIAVCNELGIELEIEVIDLFHREQFKPAYIKINPNHKVPTLVDGDFVVWESNAILQYIVEKAQQSSLWPRDIKMRAGISKWLFWQVAHWSPPLDKIIFERCVKSKIGLGESDENVCAQAASDFEPFGCVLNDQLNQNDWVIGDQITIADFAIAAPLSYVNKARLPVSNFRNVISWYERVDRLQSWREAGLSIEFSNATAWFNST